MNIGDLAEVSSIGIALLQEVTTTQEIDEAMELEQWAAIAEMASAGAALILAFAVFFQIREARKQSEASSATVSEMKESRLAQERPHIIVDTDHHTPPYVFVVIRNIGKGAAQNITFQFSAPVESPPKCRSVFASDTGGRATILQARARLFGPRRRDTLLLGIYI
jgi:hypothetical protein